MPDRNSEDDQLIEARRTEITIETDRVWVLRPGRSPELEAGAACPACGPSVPMITAEQAAMLCGLSRREFYRLIEARRFHFAESGDGRLLVCPASLIKRPDVEAP